MKKMATKMTSRTKSTIVLLLLSFSLIGCFGVKENFEQIRNNVLSNINGSYSKNIEMGFGSITLSLAQISISFSGDEDTALMNEMLDNISEVQIGTYKGKIADTLMNFQFLEKTTASLTNDGWQTLIRTVRHHNMTSILYKDNDENLIQNMFILTISDNNLVLVELNGDLNKVIEVALRGDGINFGFAANN